MKDRDRTTILPDPPATFGPSPGKDGAEPESLGKYRLLRRLATGGMGEVYLGAVHGEAGFSKPVVIKRLHPGLSADDDFVQMLIDEARITSQLIHTNICQVMDLGVVEEDYFIAMEYIHGLDLSTLRKRAEDRFDVDAAVFIISEVLAGLDYAHRRGELDGQPFNIVHRDISPQNILVSYEGEVKIIDFGIAKARNRLVRTETGVIKGKYLYMSPEQALGKPVDHRTDIYSAGVVLYELLRGRTPLAGLPHDEMLRRICDPRIEPLHRHRRDVPRGLTRVIRKALAREPGDRYPSAQAFQTALQEWGAPLSRTDLASYVLVLFPEHTTSKRSLPLTEASGGAGGATGQSRSRLWSGREQQIDPCGATVTDGSPLDGVPTRRPFDETELAYQTREEPPLWTGAETRQEPSPWPVQDQRSPPQGAWDPDEDTRLEPRQTAWEHDQTRREPPRAQRPWQTTSADVAPAGQMRTDVEPRVAHHVVEPPLLPRRELRPDDEEMARPPRSGATRLILAVAGVVLLGGGLVIGRYAYWTAGDPPRRQHVAQSWSPADAAATPVDAARPPDRARARASTRRWRTVAVGSRPAGARIRLCGRRLRRTTPTRVRLRAGRRCRLELEIDGHEPFSTVLHAGRRTVHARLKPRPVAAAADAGRRSAALAGRLRVVSVHQAVVYVDGKEAGLTPGFERRLPAGRHRVRVFFTALERSSSTRIVTVRNGETTSVRFGP